MPRTRRISTLFRAAAAVLVACLVLGPTMGSARSSDDPSAKREEVRRQKAAAAAKVDALKAEDAEVSRALADLEANVAGQQALLAEAQRRVAEAEAQLVAAHAAVDAAKARVEVLRAEIERMAVEAFVRPPVQDTLEALQSDNISDAAIKRAMLEVRSASDADILDQLTRAQEDLEVQEAAAQAAATRAEEHRAAAQSRLSEVEAARDQQAHFAAQVEQRLNARLAEVASLEQLDSQLSAEIAAREAEIARRLREAQARARASSRPSGGGSVVSLSGGSLASVSCPSGGSITVAASIADSIQSLLNAAAGAGVIMCGGGYRDPSRQAELRLINGCPDVYSSPASSCRTPTAIPGSSMHERGLAIDFTQDGRALSRSTSGYSWLRDNAGRYGLHNLPSEPWHWSTNGN